MATTGATGGAPRQPEHRMYVDEVGNPDLRSAALSANERYLSLTGVILNRETVLRQFAPDWAAMMARHFGATASAPVILHRREVVRRLGAFAVLRDPAMAAAFDEDFLALIERTSFKVITAVMDKVEHQERYKVWRYEPYHYCLAVLVERFARELDELGSCGDVMVEARGKREDRQLMASYARIYSGGTDPLDANFFQQVLTSKDLKVLPKDRNVPGLQLADSLAHPSWRSCMAWRRREPMTARFGILIARLLLEGKYRRVSWWPYRIDGYGRKWLPD
jgi:hypothetical protein